MDGGISVREATEEVMVEAAWASPADPPSSSVLPAVAAHRSGVVAHPVQGVPAPPTPPAPPPGTRFGPPPGLAQQIREQATQAAEDGIRIGITELEAALEQARASGDAAAIAEREGQLERLHTALARIGERTEQSTTVPPPRSEPPPIPDIPGGVLVITLAFFAMVVLLVLGIPLVRALSRRNQRPRVVAAPDLEARDQLREIGHAVDAIAIEVERISDRQRQIEGVRVPGKGV